MPDIGVHFDPPAVLADAVKHFYCIRTGPGFGQGLQHLSPSLEIMLIFNFGRPIPARLDDTRLDSNQIGKVVLLGPLRKMLHYTVLAETDLIVLTFNADGFYRLFDIPVNKLQPELMHDPDELLGILSFEQLWQSLNGLNGSRERIQLLAQHLEAFMPPAENASFSLLDNSESNHSFQIAPSKTAAFSAQVSERVMQMRFKKHVGFSSKEHDRYSRFKQVIDHLISEQPGIDWLDIVDRFGYHDQSHLIKDFRHYLDTTPRKFIQELLGKTFCVNRPQSPL